LVAFDFLKRRPKGSVPEVVAVFKTARTISLSDSPRRF
jgi:hypothetical protein